MLCSAGHCSYLREYKKLNRIERKKMSHEFGLFVWWHIYIYFNILYSHYAWVTKELWKNLIKKDSVSLYKGTHSTSSDFFSSLNFVFLTQTLLLFLFFLQLYQVRVYLNVFIKPPRILKTKRLKLFQFYLLFIYIFFYEI